MEVGLRYAVRMNYVITLELIVFFTFIIPLYIYFELTWIIHQISEILGQVESGFEIANSTRLFILQRWNGTPCIFLSPLLPFLLLFYASFSYRESNEDKNMHGVPFHLLERKKIDFQREGITNLRIYQYWIFHYTGI